MPADALVDDDFQLALYLLYELHYRGLPGVCEDLEWSPALISSRLALEAEFLSRLYEVVGRPGHAEPADMDLQLQTLLDADDSPSISRYAETHATLEQLREYVIHRSALQLKEADPYSWAIPRLAGPPKNALLEILMDEYGEGVLHKMHSELFAQTMRELALNDQYGAFLDVLPATTLATVNLMSLFGLHRRWRGAIVGHLAMFERSSSLPNRRYGNGFRRHACSEKACAFFDVHVLADAVHENIAAVDLAGGLASQQPELAGDILFGARALLAVEGGFAANMLSHWESGGSSLRVVNDA